MEQNILKSILITHSKYGATIEQILDDYKDLIGVSIKTKNLQNQLRNIPGVWFELDKEFNEIWFVQSKECAHIQKMIRNQKPERPYKNFNKNRNNGTRQLKENSQSYNSSFFYRNRYNKTAHLQNFEMLGDDFFLSIAVLELGYNFGSSLIKKCGLCISGQTIADVTRRILNRSSFNKNIILNIGSVDILHGHELIDIQADFLYLLDAFLYLGINPIITTLAPLANGNFETKQKLHKFNSFLKSLEFVHVIDLSQCMLDQNGKILFECYQTEARYVTGSCRPHVLWNKIGRQIILKHIKKNIV